MSNVKRIIEIDKDLYESIAGKNSDTVEPRQVVRSFQATIADAIADSKPYETDRWIPVSEKLPDKNDFVLVYDGSDMLVAWYENEGMSEGWHSFDDTYDSYTPIIAWRPLPKAPESEDK